MPKYVVIVTHHESEKWIVEADNKEDAMNNFEDGMCVDEWCVVHQAESVEEITDE